MQGWPSGVNHDPTAGYGSAGPWNEHQRYAPTGYQGYAPYVRNEPMAGWALGLSVFTVLCCNWLSPLAVILAVTAQRRIDASGGYLTGRGAATAGFVLGIIGCAFLVLTFVLMLSGNSFLWYQ